MSLIANIKLTLPPQNDMLKITSVGAKRRIRVGWCIHADHLGQHRAPDRCAARIVGEVRDRQRALQCSRIDFGGVRGRRNVKKKMGARA